MSIYENKYYPYALIKKFNTINNSDDKEILENFTTIRLPPKLNSSISSDSDTSSESSTPSTDSSNLSSESSNVSSESSNVSGESSNVSSESSDLYNKLAKTNIPSRISHLSFEETKFILENDLANAKNMIVAKSKKLEDKNENEK
jgi:hypothetical protein